MLAFKQANAINGFETSTFTVCCRIRPVLPFDEAGSQDKFECIFPDQSKLTAGEGMDDYREGALLLNPKVTLQGKPTLEPVSFNFDYTFGPEEQNDTLFEKGNYTMPIFLILK